MSLCYTLFMIVLAYILTLPVFVLFDFGWAFFLMRDFYMQRIGHVLSGTVYLPAGVAFYLVIVFALYYLAIMPGYHAKSLSMTLINAAILGVAAYGTYDLTNMATIANWPLSITLVDMVWGGIVAAVSALAGYYLLTFFGV